MMIEYEDVVGKYREYLKDMDGDMLIHIDYSDYGGYPVQIIPKTKE